MATSTWVVAKYIIHTQSIYFQHNVIEEKLAIPMAITAIGTGDIAARERSLIDSIKFTWV